MSAVLPFPGARAAARGGQRSRTSHTLSAIHPTRAGNIISWVGATSCECCGRPTLAGRVGLGRVTLCAPCSPPDIA